MGTEMDAAMDRDMERVMDVVMDRVMDDTVTDIDTDIIGVARPQRKKIVADGLKKWTTNAFVNFLSVCHHSLLGLPISTHSPLVKTAKSLTPVVVQSDSQTCISSDAGYTKLLLSHVFVWFFKVYMLML
jgi:hypothetical protein